MRYEEFVRNGDQPSLDAVDSAGRDGATLLIGFLETRATWALVENPDRTRSVHITQISTFDDSVPGTHYRLSRMVECNLRLKNEYVIRWANSITQIQSVRTPER
jgi:hypothetical protein